MVSPSVYTCMGSSGQFHSIFDKTSSNYGKLMTIANLLSSVKIEIHIRYLHSESRQNLINLKERFGNPPQIVT